MPEGPSYTAVLPGAGLVIPDSVGAISGKNVTYRAGGIVSARVDLTALVDIELTSRNAVVVYVGVSEADISTMKAGDDVKLTGSEVVVTVFAAIEANDAIQMKALLINPVATNLRSLGKGGNIEFTSDSLVILADADVRASGADGEVEIEAPVTILVDSTIVADKRIEIEGSGIFLSNDEAVSSLQAIAAKGEIKLKATGNIDFTGAELSAPRKIAIDAGAKLTATGAKLQSLSSSGKIELEGGDDIELNSALLTAVELIDVDAVDQILASGAIFRTTGASGEVKLEADGAIQLDSATVRAAKKVEVESKSTISLTAASIASLTGSTKGEISIKGTSLTVTSAVLKAAKKLSIKGSQVGVPADTTNGTLP